MVGAAAFVVAAVAGVVPQDRGAEATTRVHDLGRLLALQGLAEIQFDLCPRTFRAGELRDRGIDPEPAFDGDGLMELLRRLCCGEDDDVGMEVTPAGSLVVTASPSVNERVARALAGIESAALGEERLEIRVVAGALDAPMVEPTADADRRIRELVASGRGSVRRVGSTALPDGFFATVHNVATERYVADYDAEITHGSVVHDPITRELRVGLEAVARAARARDATWIDLAIRHSEPAAPMRELLLRPKAWFASGIPHYQEDEPDPDLSALTPAVFHGEIPLRIDGPRTRFLSWAGSFLLPDGKSLWIPCRATTRAVDGDGAPLALEIRVVGPYRPIQQDLPRVASDGGGATLRHVGASGSHGFSAPAPDDSTFRIEWVDPEKSPGGWPSVVTAGRRRLDVAARLERALTGLDDDRVRAGLLSRDLLVAAASPATCERIGEQLASEAAPAAPAELAGRITHGAATIAQFRIPALTGRLSTIWSGVDGTLLADWDCDVANEALVASPDMNDWLDGFALQFVVHALRGGRAQVTVDGMVNLLDGPPRLEPLLDPYTPSYEKVRAQRLPLHETRNFALVEGSALVRFGGNPLALELSIRMAQAPAARERTFDLGGLAAPRGASPATLDLCPPQAFVLEHEEEESSTEPMLDLEAARGLVERIVASGVAREDEPDAEVEALGRQLVVSAPEPVLGKVGSLLGLLETACLGEERLEVRVLSGEAPFDLPTLLDAEESDRRVAELVASGKGRVVRVGSSALADGVAAAIRSPVAETHVYDWEVEIAHGAVIFDPSVRIHETGLAVCARAARAPDATSIDVALRWFEPDDRFRERVARPTVWYSSPLPPRPDPDDPDPEDARGPSVFQAEIPLRIEYANARMVGCASSFVLANGQALWIPCRVETTAGPISCALEVRVRGPWRPMEQVLVAGSAGAPEAAVVHVGRWRSSGFGAGPMDDSTIANDSAGERDFDPWWPSIVSAQSVGVDLPDLAERTLAELGDGGGETFVVPLSDHDLYVQAPAAMRAEIVRRFERASPAGRPLELHGRVTRGAATIGEFRLPATTGKLATIWSGLDGCFLADWDVDVAGESMAGNPEVGLFLDGFALRFNARTSGDQQVQLAVSGVVNHLEGAPEIEEIRNPYTPFHEQLKSRRLFIDETRNLPCADGIAVARFGGDALALEVTVRLR